MNEPQTVSPTAVEPSRTVDSSRDACTLMAAGPATVAVPVVHPSSVEPVAPAALAGSASAPTAVMPGAAASPVAVCLLVGEYRILLQGVAQLLSGRLGLRCEIVSAPVPRHALRRRAAVDLVLSQTADAVADAAWLADVRQALAAPMVVLAPDEPEQFLAALRAGARGFIGRAMGPEQAVGCVAAVRRGGWGIPRQYEGPLVEAYLAESGTGTTHPSGTLSEREQQVVRRLGDGQSIAQVARALHLSTGTVRTDLRSLKHKLGARTTIQAVRQAIEGSLLPEELPVHAGGGGGHIRPGSPPRHAHPAVEPGAGQFP
jgi:DNA-binding NarL/FixJ family response regulator